MISIITGDIINSKKIKPDLWLKLLKKEFRKLGKSPKQWEIYRGDNFQLEIKDPMDVLSVAIGIKAAVKSVKHLDVRMSIGIGNKKYNAAKITESNGSAFIYSGEMFEKLKKEKLNMAVKTEWDDFDRDINLYLKLGLIVMNDWTVNSAEAVKIAIENENLSQDKLGKKLGIKQNTVSTRLNRAYFDEIMEINHVFKNKLKVLI